MLFYLIRPDWEATVKWLKDLGADVVTTEHKLKADVGEWCLMSAA